ncbi:unnamed protein product, partial [Mesorhabditis belari]|uniref:BTB domain-containing protein n=1 Tax=Mesorhabditis belari TaxID=2138241 RepID=A0AAF3F6C5_9BILA
MSRECIVFGSAGCEALIHTKDDQVYGLGTNYCCWLGVPSGSFEPLKIDLLCGKRIKQFAYGSGPHLLALSESGEVFAWRHNSFGQLGLGHNNQHCPTPVLVTALSGQKIIQIACGGHHSAALSDRGELFCWGLNSSGQLGIGSMINQDSPKSVHLHDRFIKEVACGHNFTLALTEAGDVYAWGYNENGQIGCGNVSNQCTPVIVETLTSAKVVISQIACGYAHSLALCDEGKLWVWGSNSCGQLGGNLMRKNLTEPVHTAKEIDRIVEIAAVHMCNITVVSNKKGKIFMWGNVRGQSVPNPVETRFSCVDDAFACFASPAVTWRGTKFEYSRQPSIVDAMRVAFDDPNSSDIKIFVDGHTIYAHKAILKLRCPYFKSRLGDLWSEGSGNQIEISDFTYNTFRAFMHWVYTDELVIDPDDAIGLLELSNCYLEMDLKARCASLLRKSVCIDNAAVLYSAALKFDAPELEDHCYKFCMDHMTAITHSDAFRRLDAHSMRHLICRAAKNGLFKK